MGSAYREGFRYALQQRYDIVIQMDGDLSHSPQYIPPMLSLLDSCDMVVGSRYIRGGGIAQWSAHRIVLSRSANKLAGILLGSSVHDITSGFKCMKTSVLKGIDFDTIAAQGYSFQIELTHRTAAHRFRIFEYPIIFQERRKGRSKMSARIILEAFSRVLYRAGTTCLLKREE